MDAFIRILVRKLSHSEDKNTRDQGVKLLKKRIATMTEPFSATDIAKIWRGLFFCVWHSDKPLVQDTLARKLGALTSAFRTPAESAAFARGLFAELCEKWKTVDDLRADKYRRLVRWTTTHLWVMAARNGFSEEALGLVENVLVEGPFAGGAVKEFPIDLSVYLVSILIETVEAALKPEFVPLKEGEDEETRRAPAAVGNVLARCAHKILLEGVSRTLIEETWDSLMLPLVLADSGIKADVDLDVLTGFLATKSLDMELHPDVRGRLNRYFVKLDTIIKNDRREPEPVIKSVQEYHAELKERLDQAYHRKRLTKERLATMTRSQLKKDREARKKSNHKRALRRSRKIHAAKKMKL